jgi:hypothetical protein
MPTVSYLHTVIFASEKNYKIRVCVLPIMCFFYTYLECVVSRSAMILSDKKQLNCLRLPIPLTTIWTVFSLFCENIDIFQLLQRLQCQEEVIEAKTNDSFVLLE